MSNKVIGLLGGIGPESTGLFYLKLINKFVERFNPKANTEYPHILINSVPAPELTFNKGDKEILLPYVEGLRFLEENGADIIGIICNTAHLYFDILQSNLKRKIINLHNEVESELKRKNIKSIAVFGSPFTIKGDLYRFNGIRNIDLDDNEIEQCSSAITNYNLGINKEIERNMILDLVKKYSRSVDCVILGCTEISLMAEGLSINKIDPMDILIEAILREYEK